MRSCSIFELHNFEILQNLANRLQIFKKGFCALTSYLYLCIILVYKILNDLSAPQLSNPFVKLNATNINYNLRNIETDLALPRPYNNFSEAQL